jgi:hypothetical protein
LEAQVLEWLSGLSSTVVRLSIGIFLALNATMATILVVRRDRALVQKYGSPWLAANLVLIGAGVGTPLLVGLTKFAVNMMSGVASAAVSVVK